jgi:molecular chaperone GrpE
MSNENETNTPPESTAGADAAPDKPAVDPRDEAIAQLTQERDKFKDQLLRSLADLDNFRKRAAREREEFVRKAREDFLREMLPVFDNLDRALHYVNAGSDAKSIGQGIEMVLRMFDDTLSRLGGKRIKPVGQAFDPNQHEAIAQIESAEHPVGVVVREEQAGYMLQDRLVRPALVAVSRGAPQNAGSSSDNTPSSNLAD